MNFLRLFQLVGRHKWLLLAIVTLATTATWFGSRLKGSAFMATATLMPQEKALQAMGGTGTVMNGLGEEEQQSSQALHHQRVESLIALMMSPRVLGAVSERLKLGLAPNQMERMIKVDDVTSDVLRLKATARSAQLSQDLVNGLASTFVQFYGELSTNAINDSIRLLKEQQDTASKELMQTQTSVQKYKEKLKISSLTDQLNGVLTRLNAVRQAREGTSAQLAEDDAQLSQFTAQIAQTPRTIRMVEQSNESPTAKELRDQIGTLEKDLAMAKGSYTEAHPKVQDLKAKLASATRRLKAEAGRMIENVRVVANPAYNDLVSKRQELVANRDGRAAKLGSYESSVLKLQNEMEHYSGADVQLANLMQRYNAADQRYAGVVTRLRRAQSEADAIRSSSAITIVDLAGPQNPPLDVSFSTAVKLTVAAFAMSLGLSIFILAAYDYLDRRVRTSGDAAALTELPIAGIIPRALPKPGTTPLPQLTALMPASPEGEAYRFLALQLLMSRSGEPARVLMLATPRPGQGATTTISNLATTLAQGNRRVILVDADLRRPSLHTVFETSNDIGLTTVLAEGLPVERALQSTAIPNLALLPGGPLNENPWTLLRSNAMEGLVRRLRQMADFVLIDTPSAGAFADAFNVAPLADGAFMVVRDKHLPTGIEQRIKHMLEEAGVKVFGTILNGVPIENVESCRYHSEYYGKDGKPKERNATPALPAGRQ